MAFTFSVNGNGKSALLRSPSNSYVSLQDGSTLFTVKDPGLRELKMALERHKLPTEDSPFTAGSKIRQMAEEMRSAVGPMNLEQNIYWLIEVLVPRLMLSEQGVLPLQESNFRSSSLGQFLLNTGVSARNNDPIMSGESILSQQLTTIQGFPSSYLSFFNETETAMLAVSVLRASFRDAIVTETVTLEGTNRMSVGIFIGQDELVNFCFSPVHPDFNVLALYSDSAVKSMLVLESAENMFKRVFMSEDIPISVEDKITMIRQRAELSLRYWEDNIAAPGFLNALDSQLNQDNMKYQCNLLIEQVKLFLRSLAEQGIGTEGGFLSKGKPGLLPAFIELKSKGLIDSVSELVSKYGKNDATAEAVNAIFIMCQSLAQLGVSRQTFANIVGYRISKLEA